MVGQVISLSIKVVLCGMRQWLDLSRRMAITDESGNQKQTLKSNWPNRQIEFLPDLGLST